ncbi:MAG: ABC transporter permease [Thermoplasmata archaeon]
MATPTVVQPHPAAGASSERQVPETLPQILKLARYQLREYLRSMRFVALLAIIVALDVILSIIVAHYRATFVTTPLPFYSNAWAGGAMIVTILSAVFFGGDAIAGEFQNKTGYFLMGLPIRRTTVYVGKFLAAFAASLGILVLNFFIIVANGAIYFGGNAFPWQLGVSFVLAVTYLLAVLGATFLFSSLFKTSAYGFVLTAILFLFGFAILQALVANLIDWQPWMIISYAQPVVGNVLASHVQWGFSGTAVVGSAGFGSSKTFVTWTPGVGEGVLIMLGYFLVTAAAGLALFSREEFT